MLLYSIQSGIQIPGVCVISLTIKSGGMNQVSGESRPSVSLAMADSFGSEAPAVAVMDAVSLFPWEVILLFAKAAGEKWHFDLQGHNTAVI